MSYWDVHGLLAGLVLGFCLAMVPRTTTFFLMLLTTFVSGGFFWWLGWFIAPHILVAGLATLTYWHTNPFLVILAWVWALLGTGVEVSTTGRKINNLGKSN